MEPLKPEDERLSCRSCGHTGKPTLMPSGPHLKATCARCGAYIKFVSQAQRPKARLDTMKKWYREMSPAERYSFSEWIEQLEEQELEAA